MFSNLDFNTLAHLFTCIFIKISRNRGFDGSILIEFLNYWHEVLLGWNSLQLHGNRHQLQLRERLRLQVDFLGHLPLKKRVILAHLHHLLVHELDHIFVLAELLIASLQVVFLRKLQHDVFVRTDSCNTVIPLIIAVEVEL